MKHVFWIAVLALCLCGCDKKEPKPDYSTEIIGTWIVVSADNRILPSDEMFVNRFESSGSELYAARMESDDGAQWVEVPSISYRLDGDILYEEGTLAGKHYSVKTRILIRDGAMACRELECKEDGVSLPELKTFAMYKTETDYRGDILGTWKGHETTQGVAPAAYDTYWQYLADGTYNYYYYDESLGGYVRKADNDGRYFLYGELFASNFTNDLLSGGQGPASECWRIFISGDEMSWVGLREGEKTTTFLLSRVAGPPPTVN